MGDAPMAALSGSRLDVSGTTRPPLARDRVRFVGEPVAAVVAENAYLCADAVNLVDVRYDLLPAVIGPDSPAVDDVVVHEGAGTNTVKSFDFGESSADSDAVVVRQRVINQRLQPAPMEPRACAARWERDGRVSVWLSSQAPHLAREAIASFLGIELDRVRMHQVDVGGGFGAKVFITPEEVLVPFLSQMVGRPLKWVETRTESMQALPAGRGQITTVTLRADRTGKVRSVEYDILQDAGAYPGAGAFMPGVAWMMSSGPYAIPGSRLRGRSVVTTTAPTGPYRGAGRPEPAYALERAMDLLAADLRLDPAEVRRRNLIRGADFPYTTASGTVYDSGNLIAALDRVLKAGRYRTLREEQLRRRRNGDRERLGLGLAAFVDIAGRSSPPEFGAVEIATDGTLVIRAGCGPHGQGHGTVLATIASERLGGSLTARSRFVHSDTDEVPFGGGSYGSKSLQVAGSAVDNAAATLVERGRRLAAQVLEADSADVVLDLVAGAFHVVGARRPLLTWQDLAVAAAIRGERLYEEARLEGAGPTVPGGVYLAVVSLDVETWIARVLELITCDDAGRIVNPMLAEGQVQGGLVQGIAQALFEEQRYDSGGSLLTSTFLDYLI
ncbi:MAG TPA: xanthine dehydrogenase family protein molybdopterin-binding subunit, partial [Candidatus Limnocylindrales bacterium]